MRRWSMLTAAVAVGLLGVVATGAWVLQNEVGPRGAGYHAKILCTAVYVAGRSPRHVIATDLGRFWYVQGEIEPDSQTATSSLLGFARSTAVYREGLGCTLVRGISIPELRRATPQVPAPRQTRDLPWPTGDVGAVRELPAEQQARLEAVLDDAFSEPNPAEPKRRTRAVVVIHHGRIVAERYAPGFEPETALVGWSMTKSVTGALVGIAVGEGLMDVRKPAAIEAWAEDDRAKITPDMLLRMSSGLASDETYDAFGGVTRMLFVEPAAWAYAERQPLEHEPDSFWIYDSGSSNLLQALLRDAVGPERYLAYPRTALFDRIGMQGAVLEPDSSGVFVGSSFMAAPARDWARFGLLHLQDGVWEGERILPEGWVDYVSTPTPKSPQLKYGAHWWTNVGTPGAPTDRRFPSMPTDTLHASGFEWQAILVVPSRDAVIVRLGLTPGDDKEVWDLDAFGARVLAALPEDPPAEEAPEAGEDLDTDVEIEAPPEPPADGG